MSTDTEHNSISEEITDECFRHRLVPIDIDERKLTVAAAEGERPEGAIPLLSFISRRDVHVVFWPKPKIENYLQRVPSRNISSPENDETQNLGAQEGESHYPPEHSDDAVVQFLNQLIRQAMQRRASDIHFEPYANSYRIRLRIDGSLQEAAAPPLNVAAQITSRLKIMANLNIAERRLPQDGQMIFHDDRQRRSLRVSTLPVSGGEKVVLRVMPTGTDIHSIASIGMSDDEQRRYRETLSLPQGMILVTGPTGSGKTITLYSGLGYLNDAFRNLCSVEDPIEIPLSGINQTQVNGKIGLTFNTALRAFLRQDPDVLMVGEIRDQETASTAIEAAQTGHLVLATLHTNGAAETLVRLGQMGIASYLLASSLKLIIAQRLVRCLCPHCKQPAQQTNMPEEHNEQNGVQGYVATGCERCVGGYYGRTGVYEMLHLTDIVQRGIADGLNAEALHRLACSQGMVSLKRAGMKLVEQGITTLNELYRTLGSDRWSDE
ncbi:Type II traffic warden ATPase [Leminorella richardii]|uniref:Type II traffic warden ATPase n=1 Tax=Leminorella richardii TaxID=158841 RepID=A0A2X4UUH6_9GAMM|nr:ATPase, T2SS/T4P/T4SS family [Leminorella richardii]SQI42461.1 Type II traffic warden ATPase [Leminorella richardii]